MSDPGNIGQTRALVLVGRGVAIELVRRKDLYVLSILMGVYLMAVLAFAFIGIENASTATFLLNLGITLAYFSAHLLTLLLVARQVPDDLENRTIYPMLAKPVERTTYLLGKWAAASLCGFLVFVVLGGLVWAFVPAMEPCHAGMLFQMLALQAVSLSLLAALAQLLSLVAPKGVTVVVCGLHVAFGANLLGFMQARLAAVLPPSVVEWVFAYVPDFTRFNAITRYTDGIVALGMGEFTGLIAEGAIFTAVLLLVGAHLFGRRAL